MQNPFKPGLRVFGLTVMAVLTASCQEPITPAPASNAPAATANQVALPSVARIPPAEPIPGTPVSTSPVPSDISKTEQSNAMPMPGQANDHSTPSTSATQKANAKDSKP